MNVFKSFTRKSLKQNRVRTIVTIIGIVLSMALFTAVIEGAYSGIDFLIRDTARLEGNYHGVYKDVTGEQVQNLLKNREISKSTTMQTVGWADIGSSNEYKPYLLIKSAGEDITDFIPVNILEGRMPQNSGEILMPEHLISNGEVQVKVGDTVTLEVGKRAGNDGELDDLASFDPEAGEQITETQTRQYKIVGIYQRLPHNIEKYSCPGYTALTVGEADRDSYDLFVISKHPSKFTKKFAFGELNERLVANNDVLRLCGDINSGSLRSVFYGFAGVLVFLIALGSISLIFNSFSISVSERTKQFGILKSVGATRKQIRGAVLYEALLLSAIAIPIGLIVGILGIGITLWCLRDSFSAISGGNGVKMYLVLNIPALLTAVAVCLVTTLISAWLPAKKAVKINPIEAIRQSGDVKVRGKDVKTSKLTSKLFGFEGTLAVKNFKRNRKRYRSTVISLALSITLFIAASSFCSYFKNTLTGVSKDNVDCDIFFSLSDEDRSKCQQVVEILGKTEGVESFSYYSQNVETVNLKPENISNEYKSLPKDAKQEYTDGSFGMMAVINFFDDETFNAICAQNGINPEKYYDKADPRALVQNDYGDYYYDRKDKRRWFSCSPIKESTLPFTAEVSVLKDIEGYILYEEEYTDDGEDIIAFYYYPEEYIENFPFDGEHELDRGKAVRVTKQEAYERVTLTVDAAVKGIPGTTDSRYVCFAYPLSVADSEAFAGIRKGETDVTSFLITAPAHDTARENITNNLKQDGINVNYLYDLSAEYESVRTLTTVVNVFSYGFIIIISLIAVANVFNTISTNVLLRRRELAMLKSVGLSRAGFRKMSNYECLIYGLRGLALGLPAAVLVTYVIYRITGLGLDLPFYIPWTSIVIAVASVFAVVFITMLYATSKIKNDNPIDVLKKETL